MSETHEPAAKRRVDLSALKIEPLAKNHSRGAFCCGVPNIDNYFQKTARREHDNYQVRVFVTCFPGTNEVIGFHSLCLTSLKPGRFWGLADKFDRVNAAPCVYLSRIGVTKDSAGQGIGKILMLDAFERTLAIADNAGTFALTLDALNRKTAKYYETLGFQCLHQHSMKMFIPLAPMREALA